MYNYQNIGQFLSKNPKTQGKYEENIHKNSKVITIFRGKNLSFPQLLKPLVAFF